MAHLTFPFGVGGLTLEVLIGLDGKTTATLHAAGQPITMPVRARGLLDTGTDATALAPWVFQQLGLQPTKYTTTHTASGTVNVAVFEVSLTISGIGGTGRSMFVLPTLLVTELTTPLPNVDGLVGMDVISTCVVLIDGPARQFTLSF
jgi:hypothetical protein